MSPDFPLRSLARPLLRRAVLLAIALAPLAGGAAPATEPAPSPDTAALLAEAREAQVRDLEAWHGFAFRRRVLRQRLDRQGRVKLRQELEFEVEPIAGGRFDERLVSIDGRAPTAAEVREHRRAARFSKHYGQAREGRFGGILGIGELDFNVLFGALDYAYRGRRDDAGVTLHRLGIEPIADDDPRGTDRLAAATTGELGLTVDGLHLARARTRLARPVTQGLVEVERLQIDFEARPTAGGVWLPARIEVQSSLRGFLHIRAHNVYTYSEYRRRAPVD